MKASRGERREPSLIVKDPTLPPATAVSRRSLLGAKGLVKRYRRRTVVCDVSFNVSAGEIVGLLGPNGAGKTTSFYMIVGLVKPDGGSIELDGTDITRLPMHARARLGVGYLPQEASVFRKLSVADNIMAILEIRQDLSPQARKQELDRLLAELHIGHVRDGLGLSLSGGERRRTEIARALAANPRFILLDEPFAGVDPIAVLDIQQIVRHLAERGIGVLITDHNVRETLGICNRAYILNEGLVIADGAPAHVLENETVRRVYLGEKFKL
jgi:lipopolysaccharide export system ATP-binding protein